MPRIIRHFSLFVVLSLLLHLGVFLYFATRGEETVTPEITPVPFFVDLREAEQKPRELDLPMRQQDTLRTQPARRMAESEQMTEREEAPKGRDSRDTTTVATTTENPPIITEGAQQEAIRPIGPPVSESGNIPVLSLENLLSSAKSAAQSIADLDPETNRKMRRDVEEGRAVWLDTEKDILGSFYKRFRNSVEDVWDYPKEAIARGEFGVSLYRIEINRAGVLVNEPELLKSSGSPRLDAEAARAVRAAEPRFGFLPDAYRYETLTIFAYFDYRLGSRPNIYGESYYR
ncbi:MAG: TonB family protein [Desulfuromonadales bacterium]|nr:TonB family protein [Desulfuromonadales bacterium]